MRIHPWKTNRNQIEIKEMDTQELFNFVTENFKNGRPVYKTIKQWPHDDFLLQYRAAMCNAI